MVGYDEDVRGYKLFYPSSHKTFIKRSVQFIEYPKQEIKLVKGDCSHPPLNDDVSDVSNYDFFEYYMEGEDDDIHAYNHSPIRIKWAEKTIQVAGDLAGDPLDTRKTRYQFHNALSTCDSNIPHRCFLMVGSNPHLY